MRRKLIEKKIEREFTIGVQKLFNDNLLFGFIGGGIAKGYWDKSHDIDMFICVNGAIKKKDAKQYIEWYYELHEKYGFSADGDYPGEIVEKDVLIKKLSILDTLDIKLKVTDISVKEAIIWADMIVGKKFGFVGDSDFFSDIQKKYKNYPKKWKEEVLALIPPENQKIWQNKSYLLIMERFMQYPKTDARAFYQKYKLSD